MNRHALLHYPDSRYSFPISSDELVIRLRTSKEDQGLKVYVEYAPKHKFHIARKIKKMEKKYSDSIYDYYETSLKLEEVSPAYVFQIVEGQKLYYFSEDGLTESYDYSEGFYNFFQVAYINQVDVMPVVDWMKEAVFYQIFVDRFYRGDYNKDDSYINQAWNDLPRQKSFAGGDLKGIEEKLVYLKKLGINALYLTPIFLSPTNHKYETVDYYQIDPNFGDKEDLKSLVDKAHEMGFKIVLDAVFNHVSHLSKEFQDVVARGRKSPYYDWFIIDGEFPDLEKENYEKFSVVAEMPKWNSSNPQVQDYLIEVGLYWIRNFDIDGWRLDVADEVSHDFWRKFRKTIKKEKKDAVLIGENWHDSYPYLMGDQHDSIMNYAFTKACLDYFKGKFDAEDMAGKLNELQIRNLDQVNKMNLNLLDSHDTYRFFTEVNKDKDKLKSALALMFMYRGAPCVYYGTEICLEGEFDPDSRRSFDWDQDKWDLSVMETIKKLSDLKKDMALIEGDISIAEEDGLLLVERDYKGKKRRLYINQSEKKVELDFSGESVYMSHKYEDNILQTNGYLIV